MSNPLCLPRRHSAIDFFPSFLDSKEAAMTLFLPLLMQRTYASIKPRLLCGNVVRFYQTAYRLPLSALNLGLQDIPPLLMYFMQRYYTWTRMGSSLSKTTTQIFPGREKQMWFLNTGITWKREMIIRNEHSVIKTRPHVIISIYLSIYRTQSRYLLVFLSI